MTIERAREVLAIESKAVEHLAARLDASFDRAVDLLVSCKGRIVVTGMGKSGIIAQKIAATLSSTGTPSLFMHPAEAVHGDLGMIVAGDVLIALSNSGETEEIVRLLELVKRIGARIIALSGDPTSSLARHADLHLDVSVDQEACGWDLIPTASTTATLALGDALAVCTYEKRGFSPSDFAKNHPGGRLARKLIPVASVMHTGDELPRVSTGATLSQAVQEIDRKKLGMTCIVNDQHDLVGILTDGDLRRRLLDSPNLLDKSVGEVMTAAPSTIGSDALASEALQLMESRKITSLPVLAEDGKLTGVIQIHDLWRTELF